MIKNFKEIKKEINKILSTFPYSAILSFTKKNHWLEDTCGMYERVIEELPHQMVISYYENSPYSTMEEKELSFFKTVKHEATKVLKEMDAHFEKNNKI